MAPMILLLIPAVMLLLVAIAAPAEFAARHSERFAAFLDETVRRVLG